MTRSAMTHVMKQSLQPSDSVNYLDPSSKVWAHSGCDIMTKLTRCRSQSRLIKLLYYFHREYEPSLFSLFCSVIVEVSCSSADQKHHCALGVHSIDSSAYNSALCDFL